MSQSTASPFTCLTTQSTAYSADFISIVTPTEETPLLNEVSQYQTSGSVNLSEFGDNMKRIKAMIDILFDRKTAQEATQMIADEKL